MPGHDLLELFKVDATSPIGIDVANKLLPNGIGQFLRARALRYKRLLELLHIDKAIFSHIECLECLSEVLLTYRRAGRQELRFRDLAVLVLVHAVEDLLDVFLRDLSHQVREQGQAVLKLFDFNHPVLVLVDLPKDASALPHFLRRHDRVRDERADLALEQTLLFEPLDVLADFELLGLFGERYMGCGQETALDELACGGSLLGVLFQALPDQIDKLRCG